MNDFITTFLVGLVIFILLFLILREVMCWYWKINERITLQQQTNTLLKKLLDQVNTEGSVRSEARTKQTSGVAASKSEASVSSGPDGSSSRESGTAAQNSGAKVYCTNCGQENDATALVCIKCAAKLEG